MALARALGELSARIRRARTALWCALQLASVDLPARCVRAAEAEAGRRVVGLVSTACPSARGGVGGAAWCNEYSDAGGEVLTDTEDVREDDDEAEASCPQISM